MFGLESVKTFSIRLITCSALALACSVHAENFRTHSMKIMKIEDSFEKQSVTASVNDSIAIMLPKDSTFIQGLEINIKVPKVVAEWCDSVAWSLYPSISPQPEEKTIDYAGIRGETGTFDSLSLNLLVPLEKNSTIKNDAYSHLAEFQDAKEHGFLFLRFQLVMKGVTSSLHDAEFSVSAKPILIDRGIISLKAVSPEGQEAEPYSVFLDGTQIDAGKISGSGMLTDTGDHSLSIISDSYRNELRTVNVEQAKTTEVSITFRDIKPIIRIAAPENSRVFFDDEEIRIPADPFHTTQGDHTVKFIVGDYEIVRAVTVLNGRSYNIAISMEAQITEAED